MHYPDSSWRFESCPRRSANLGGPRPIRKSRRSVDALDTIGARGTDWAVGHKISIQRVDVVDADQRRCTLLQIGKAVAADRQKIVDRDPVARRRIDRLAV